MQLMQPRYFGPFWWLFVVIFCQSTALADYRKQETQFSLEIAHTQSDWRYPTGLFYTKSSILGIQLTEAMASRLKGSLSAGYLDLSQPQNPLPAAQTTSGYYGSVALTLLLLDTRYVGMDLSGGYRYQETDGSDATTTVRNIWYDTFVQLELQLRLSSQLAIQTGGGLSQTDGEQRVSGGTTTLTTFEEAEQEFYYAGLAYWVDNTGYLRLTWLGGNRDGFRISFHRGF